MQEGLGFSNSIVAVAILSFDRQVIDGDHYSQMIKLYYYFLLLIMAIVLILKSSINMCQ